MWKFKLPTKAFYFSSTDISPSQMFAELMEILMKIDRKMGVDLFDKDFTPLNLHCMFNIVLCFLILTVSSYDVYKFVKEDFYRATFCWFAFSAAIQTAANIFVFLGKIENVNELKDRSVEFFKKPYTANSMEIFEKRLMEVTHLGAFIGILFMSSGFLFSLYPFAFAYYLEKRVILLELEFPFIDWEISWIGYGIHIIHGFYVIFCYVLMLVAAFYVVICYLITTIIEFDILAELLKELDDLAKSNKSGNNDRKIRKLLNTIIEMHSDLLE